MSSSPPSPSDFSDGDIVVDPEPIEMAATPFSLTGETSESDDLPAPKSPIRRILLIALLVIAIAAAAVLGYTAWQIFTQKNATLSTPPQIGALRLDDSQDGKDTADYLQTALAAEINLNQPVGAVYTDDAERDVLFFGGTGLIWSPGKDLDAAFAMISDDQGAVTAVHDVPAGKLGGTMQCGTTKTDGATIPVCGWADHGALAVAMFPNRTEQDSAKLLLQLRDATQIRS
jgi:hypothetical protein